MKSCLLKKNIFAWIRIGAEYVAIILLFFEFIPKDSVSKWKESGLLSILLIGVCLIISLINNFRNDNKNEKREVEFTNEKNSYHKQIKELKKAASYTLMFPLLNKAFSELHNTMRGDLTAEEFRGAFKDFCTQLSYAFEKVSNCKCHVCIKIPVKTGNNSHKITKLKAITLVRDTIRVKRDIVDNSKIDHYFNLNTDFDFIFNNIKSEKGRYFFSNSLPSENNYKNSSFLNFGDSPTFFHENASLEEKRRDWPLSYMSGITVPICPGINQQRGTSTLFGFLCIDSTEENAFDKSIDPEIICGCADGIYNPLKLYIEKFILKKQNHE